MFVGDPGPGFDEQTFLPQNLPSALVFLMHRSFSNLMSQTVIQGATSSESREGSAFISSTDAVTEPKPYHKLSASQLSLTKIGSCVPSHFSGFIIIYKV